MSPGRMSHSLDVWSPRRIDTVTRRRPFSLPKPSLSIGSYQRGPFGHVHLPEGIYNWLRMETVRTTRRIQGEV